MHLKHIHLKEPFDNVLLYSQKVFRKKLDLIRKSWYLMLLKRKKGIQILCIEINSGVKFSFEKQR